MAHSAQYQAYLDLVSGRRRGLGPTLLRGLLAVAAGPYAVGVTIRNAAFTRGLRRVHKVSVPVISVGNLTAGGTGKTPLVEWIAQWLRQHAIRVAVLSRGYGAPSLPEDRAAQAGNDETDLLARNLPDVPQLVDPDRVRSAAVAIEELEMQCLVLDDGFQHRRLARDLEIVTIDALNPFGYGHLLPRGLLREPPRSLRRANVIVITRCDQATDLGALKNRLSRIAPAAPLVESCHAPTELISLDGARGPVGWLRGRRVVAVCGIGNPDAFRRTLASTGADCTAFLVYPDHHAYTDADRAAIHETASDAQAEAVITTQKDLVRLLADRQPPCPIWALRVRLDLGAGADALETRLGAIIQPLAQHS